jgi:hypothetical protein
MRFCLPPYACTALSIGYNGLNGTEAKRESVPCAAVNSARSEPQKLASFVTRAQHRHVVFLDRSCRV